MSKGSRARESKPESFPMGKPLTKLNALTGWIAVVSAGIALSTGLAIPNSAGSAHQEPAQQLGRL